MNKFLMQDSNPSSNNISISYIYKKNRFRKIIDRLFISPTFIESIITSIKETIYFHLEILLLF